MNTVIHKSLKLVRTASGVSLMDFGLNYTGIKNFIEHNKLVTLSVFCVNL